VAGAKEGGAFLEEFRAAGFANVELMRRSRNPRSANP
jgi:hypothetical protein